MQQLFCCLWYQHEVCLQLHNIIILTELLFCFAAVLSTKIVPIRQHVHVVEGDAMEEE